LKIPVRVRAFPGSDEERLDMLAAVRRNCICRAIDVGPGSVAVIEDPCPSHDLLGQEGMLKHLVFHRRWYRGRSAD
jgi:hypothetical protein